MFSSIPLPSFSDFFKAFSPRKDIGNSWTHQGYKFDWFLSGAEALAVIALGNKKSSLTVMLPEYFCGQSLRFLRGLNVNFVFYPLISNLKPNYEKVKQILSENKVDIFIHVHYFGQVINANESRSLCDEYQLILVEDCAHIIHPQFLIDWSGDFLFFSPHKFFSVATGGILFSKIEVFEKARSVASISWKWYFNKLVKGWMPYYKTKTLAKNLVWSNQSEVSLFQHPSNFDLSLLDKYLDDLTLIIAQRRNNAEIIKLELMQYVGWKLVSNFQKTDVPYLIGMRCDNSEIARRRYILFRQEGLPVMYWPDLPGELEDNFKFRENMNRTKESLYFAIHEQLNIDDITSRIRLALADE